MNMKRDENDNDDGDSSLRGEGATYVGYLRSVNE